MRIPKSVGFLDVLRGERQYEGLKSIFKLLRAALQIFKFSLSRLHCIRFFYNVGSKKCLQLLDLSLFTT